MLPGMRKYTVDDVERWDGQSEIRVSSKICIVLIQRNVLRGCAGLTYGQRNTYKERSEVRTKLQYRSACLW